MLDLFVEGKIKDVGCVRGHLILHLIRGGGGGGGGAWHMYEKGKKGTRRRAPCTFKLLLGKQFK